jgi:hypothetical protein
VGGQGSQQCPYGSSSAVSKSLKFLLLASMQSQAAELRVVQLN